MASESSRSTPIRVHLTNVAGTGASQLLLSLLPAFERNGDVVVTEIHLPDRGPLARYQAASGSAKVIKVHRRLPNALSRVVECLWSSRSLASDVPLLVLGDLPLACRAPQTVFVQNAHLLAPAKHGWNFSEFKFAVARWIFRANAKYADAFVVQTNWMRQALASSYPSIEHKIHVVGQPVPHWMLNAPQISRRKAQSKLRLFYPSAGYPHKNHRLLAGILTDEAASWPVSKLQLTLPADSNPAANVSWIECVGFLDPVEMISAYQNADALVFLSTKESLGFPLVEAMFLGLPVICPDLPYARTLCQDEAIYFDPNSVPSLKRAIENLDRKLRDGWTPNWSLQLQKIPKSWEDVAAELVKISRSKTTKKTST